LGGIVLSTLGAIGLFLFPLASGPFAAMFKDMGDAELPLLTRVALSAWFPIGLGVVVVAGAVAGARGGGPLSRRRALILVSAIFAIGGMIACVIGMYLPIFALAGKIKAD
jgi:hypothetical protein